MPCLDSADIEQLDSGTLPDEARASYAEHVAACPRCDDLRRDVRANLAMIDRVRDSVATGAAGAARSQSPDAPELPEQIGPYRVLSELGRGGMAVAYLAEQTHPRRHVAIKVLRTDDFDGVAIERFRREAQVLALLRHPAIALVHDAGIAPVQLNGGPASPRPYLVMEYIDGARLDEYLRDAAPTIATRVDLLVRICAGAHHAHARGVIHRDLKPANILVEGGRRGAPALPRILDFGVARLVAEHPSSTTTHTGAGQLLGTVPYMSPEQIAGDPSALDVRSDVYTLGVVAFEALCGRLPIDVERCSLPEAARRIRDRPPARLGAVDRRLRGDLETIVATALEKDPARRYQSAAELGADLTRWRRREPIVARPARLAYQCRMLARRRPALVTGIAGVGLALVVGVAALAWQSREAARARDDAEARLADALRQGDFLVNDVSARLGRLIGAAPLRLGVAEEVHDYFERLAEQHPDHPAIRRGRWESLRLLANLRADRDDREAALAMMRRSHALVVAALERDPRDTDVRFQHGYSLGQLARHLVRAGDGAGATTCTERARDAMADLVSDDPASALYRDHLAIELTNLAGRRRADGDDDAAGALLDQAARAASAGATRHPDDPRFDRRALAIERERGALAEARGHHHEAATHYGAAVTQAAVIRAGSPADPGLLAIEAMAYTGRGRARLAHGDATGSHADMTAAVERLRELVREEPERVAYGATLADACAGAALAADALGRANEARTLAREAIASVPDGDDGRRRRCEAILAQIDAPRPPS